ncbi:23S rRNA (guanosine(2251)-2'-O)-methyltransferase RlmB [Desulfogranum marinum]|uniref:23S rRNA (guanosine(2251)-2'-O)-methyltransferase RlmB n=1 Tax=Desulfogranum marinum TaxID=453220 RepID=UPI0029C6A454|nr:23S rRNA (guanosine(2251)-2'-O)-methyltransferase RlmB [Desulfogranum marinum]
MAKEKVSPKGRANAEQQHENDSDFIWGINSVFEALAQRPESVSELSVQKGKAGPRIQQLVDLARQHKIKLRFVDPQRFGVPRNCNHQGVVARVAAAPLFAFEELLALFGQAQVAEAPKVLVLDSIQDPHNLGSILRSALAAGFTDIILTRERSAPLGGTVAKISAGAVSHLRICQVTNLSDSLQKMKDAGFWVYGAVVDGNNVGSIYDIEFSGALCLVIGSEGKGIRPLVQKQCDQLVTIPMDKTFDSLNAAVAAAVIMFEIRRQVSARNS